MDILKIDTRRDPMEQIPLAAQALYKESSGLMMELADFLRGRDIEAICAISALNSLLLNIGMNMKQDHNCPNIDVLIKLLEGTVAELKE